MDKAVFLDRDGVINVDIPGQEVLSIDDFEWVPGSKEALMKLRKAGFKIIVVSNQAKIGRGVVTREEVEQVNGLIRDFVDDVLICPHKAENRCSCRKPEPGMLIKACERYGIDPKNSFMIGDKMTDIEAGKKIGCTTILVKTGYGGKDKKHEIKPDFVTKDLLEAVDSIILK